MQPALEQLLVLQDRDKKIRALKRELESLPAERKGMEGKLSDTASNLDASKLRAKQIEVERKKLEVDANAKRESINRFKTQQFQTRKNEEFQALSNEIKRYEKDIETIEDKELEFMEELERLKPLLTEAERNAAQEKQQIQSRLSDLDAKKATIEKHLADLAADRQKLTEGLDEDLLDRYQRLFASKGEAIVAVEHEVCMGCHMKITTQTAVRVRGDREIVSCEQCGRILYPGG